MATAWEATSRNLYIASGIRVDLFKFLRSSTLHLVHNHEVR
ncbi:hypothetical protein OsccyDRAFT_4919 [Leptolyngbyaceae cyanobacterium JSC-12]|nr:hypothetical protein OsccyDRAFT_4919 [Leptolyngbyaceae cyanobacterium JSC-12]